MIFKAANNELKIFNKTLLSSNSIIENSNIFNTVAYNEHGSFNLQNVSLQFTKFSHGFVKIKNALQSYNENLTKSTQLQYSYIHAVGNQNTILGDYLTKLNGAKASMGGYIKYLITAKGASIGLQIASKALNSVISIGLSYAITYLISKIIELTNKKKEAREEIYKNAESAKEESNQLFELLNKYNELSRKVTCSKDAKEDFLSTQLDILYALGVEISQIDMLIDKYGSLNVAINHISLDSLKNDEGDLIAGINESEKDLIKVGGAYEKWYQNRIDLSRNIIYGYKSSVPAFEILQEAGVDGVSYNKRGGSLYLKNFYQHDLTPEQVFENYQHLKSAQAALNAAVNNGKISMDEMIKIPLYVSIQSRLKDLESAVNNYNSSIYDLNKNIAQQQIIENLLQESSIPETKEEFELFQQNMIDAALASKKFKGSQDDIKNTIVNVLSTMSEFKKFFENMPNTIVLSSFSDFFYSDDFSDTAQKLLDLAKSGEITPEVLESTKEYNELLKKTGDTAQEAADKILNLLSDQEKLAAASNVLDSIKSAYDEFNELGFVTASTLEDLPDVLKNLEVFDIFSQIAGDPTHGKEKIQQAFNDIITHYLISQDTLSGIIGASESSIQSYIANLKEMGITNAEEIVNSLRTIYKSDYDNWCDLLVKKAASYNDFSNMVNKISASEWASFMGYSGLTPELEKKMEEGAFTFVDALRIAGNTSEAQKIMEQQAKYQQYLMEAEKKKTELGLELKTIYSPNESSTDSLDSSTQSFDWLQTKITRTEEALDRLSQKASNTYSSWTERNNALSQSIDRTKAAIELQRQAYSAYMKEADSVGLPEHYKSLVQSGAINTSDIVDSKLADQINEYQELYEKALSCSDTVSELEQSLNELTFGTRWNNIKTELDAVVGVFDTDIELIQTKLDNLEIRGLFADSSYYSDMKDLTAKKLVTLNSEAGQLKSILGSMSKDNEGYNNLFSELMDINKEIAELENNCIEFNTKMRGLDWEIFDYLEKAVNRITDETEYLIGLLEKEKLFDENGSFTKYGDAALGLHSAAYETHKRQADDYYAEIAKLQKQLADGAGQDVLEHYNELTDAHRAAVNAADSEKQSMLELIEDGYNAQLDAIQKLIDKKKEQLDSEKDLYDYQKSIAEKSAKVSSLEKQKLAYADDDSEEAMSRIQQLNVQLEEAKTDLAEAEYDKYLKDTENMLDKLSEDYENWINKRLDDEDSLLSEIISAVSDKGDQINNALNEIASKNDTFISDSIRGIFDADQPFAAVMNGVKDAVTGVGTAVAELKNAVLGISGTYGTPNAADKNTSVAGGIQPDKNASASKNSGSTSFAPSGGNSGRQNTPSGSGSWGSWFVKKNDAYPKNKLNKDSSIVDRLKFFGIDSSFASRAAYYKAMGGDGSYIGSASQNIWMLNQMKSHGYKSGTYGAASGPHWTQENGGEFILRKSDGAMLVPLGQGDMVFSNESSKRLYEFAQNPEAFMKKYNLSAPVMTAVIPYSALDYKLPNSAKAAQRNASASVSIGGINITCNEVQNARELMEDVTDHLIRNNRFEKAMSTMINNRMTGKNPLEHLKYVKH